MRFHFVIICVVLNIGVQIFAQSPPPPPVLVNEADIRYDSIKIRSIELERVKREADKPVPNVSLKEQQLKFKEIKNEFETIQKLQDSIVKTYTKGKTIDFTKISELAAELSKNAIKLDENLFDSKQINEVKLEVTKKNEQKNVRDLIIELDNAIGKFVESNVFQNSKLVNPDESEQAHQELRKIIKISEDLVNQAQKLK
jgi:hypothetical protein